jgi:5-methylcytosine-specific restriction endonuclease McrA
MRTYTLRHPERAKAHSKKYISANLPKFAAREAMKRAKKQKATPVWMSEHHKYLIEQFYLNRPAGCDVDHIVPLNGADVCGLHVIWNLQYLDSRENRRKSNKLFK